MPISFFITVPAFKEQEVAEKNSWQNFYPGGKKQQRVILGKEWLGKQNHFLSYWVQMGKKQDAERC